MEGKGLIRIMSNGGEKLGDGINARSTASSCICLISSGGDCVSKEIGVGPLKLTESGTQFIASVASLNSGVAIG